MRKESPPAPFDEGHEQARWSRDMSDSAFELRWDDHVILEHDGQSREERERLYVGDDGFAQLMVDGLAESGLATGWTTHLELDQNEGGFLRTPIDSVAAGRARSTAYRGSFALASDEAELEMFLAGAATVSVQVRMPPRGIGWWSGFGAWPTMCARGCPKKSCCRRCWRSPPGRCRASVPAVSWPTGRVTRW